MIIASSKMKGLSSDQPKDYNRTTLCFLLEKIQPHFQLNNFSLALIALFYIDMVHNIMPILNAKLFVKKNQQQQQLKIIYNH